MFERFTEPARTVVTGARDEARGLGHAWIGTEHLLIAVLRAPQAPGAATLTGLGVTAQTCREAVREVVTAGDGDALGPQDAEALQDVRHRPGRDRAATRRRPSARARWTCRLPEDDGNGARCRSAAGRTTTGRPGTCPSRRARRRRWNCRCGRLSRVRTVTSVSSTSSWPCCARTTASPARCGAGCRCAPTGCGTRWRRHCGRRRSRDAGPAQPRLSSAASTSAGSARLV